MTVPEDVPLSAADLLLVWKAAVDPEYGRDLSEKGDGYGYETIGQAAAQYERLAASSARSSETLFVRHWSGENYGPATGSKPATATVTATRSKAFGFPIVFARGLILIETQPDFSRSGTIKVETGRDFAVSTPTMLAPGDAGGVSISTVCTLPGYGGNGALAGMLTTIISPPTTLNGSGATVIPGTQQHALVCSSLPDAPAPSLVGQYLIFTAGANNGLVARVVGYTAAAPNSLSLGTLNLSATASISLSGISGTFTPGETVSQAATGWSGVLVGVNAAGRMVVERLTGTDPSTNVAIVGVVSGASATVAALDWSASLNAETGSAAWRVADWVTDLGILVTNAADASGGTAATLDMIGSERLVYRQAGEPDEPYRARVIATPDVVSPNAVRRAIARVLAPYGLTGTLREVGLSHFRGVFADGDATQTNAAIAFAYDLDFATRPADRFKLNLDWTEFRGFFVVGVPSPSLGDFGLAFDAGATNAFDAAPFLAFFDGYPLTSGSVYRALWQELDRVRAYGVGFDIVRDDLGYVTGE